MANNSAYTQVVDSSFLLQVVCPRACRFSHPMAPLLSRVGFLLQFTLPIGHLPVQQGATLIGIVTTIDIFCCSRLRRILNNNMVHALKRLYSSGRKSDESFFCDYKWCINVDPAAADLTRGWAIWLYGLYLCGSQILHFWITHIVNLNQ